MIRVTRYKIIVKIDGTISSCCLLGWSHQIYASSSSSSSSPCSSFSSAFSPSSSSSSATGGLPASLDSFLMTSWSLDFTSSSSALNTMSLGVLPTEPRVTCASSPCYSEKMKRIHGQMCCFTIMHCIMQWTKCDHHYDVNNLIEEKELNVIICKIINVN